MESLPCKECKGLCCGPVPVTSEEFKKIKQKIKSLSTRERLEIEKQIRYYGTCIFYDSNKDRCSIYSARPEICRVFGHHKNLACFLKPELAIKYFWEAQAKPIGILSIDFTWKDF